MDLAYLQNPLDLPGPEFLRLYIITLLLAVTIALVLRYLTRGRLTGPVPTLDLDPYETAYLMGGEKQAVETAIAVLVKRKVLKVHASDRKLSARAALSPAAHKLERAVYDEAGRSGEDIGTVRARASTDAEQLAVRLQAGGLILDGARGWSHQFISPLVVLAVTAFGAMKILIGLSRGRPVGFLFFLTILSAVIAGYLIKHNQRRTPVGDMFVDLLLEKNAALGHTARTSPTGLDATDLALAVALFGMSALPFTGRLGDLQVALRPPQSSSSGGLSGIISSWNCSSGSSSSCSGSSCGSGSSCSSGSSCGGGGGGGGCGGCGSS